jgi:hypothetical protein
LAGAVLFLGAPACWASPVLTLVNTGPDLTNLTVGDTASLEVTLSGLNPGDEVDFLAATVKFNPADFGTPTVTPGPIVPDTTGFVSAGSGPSLADAFYDDLVALSGADIVDNGVFYSFTIQAQTPGKGTVFFEFVDSLGTDGTGAPLPTVTGTPDHLDFVIHGSAATPEPSSGLLFGALAAGMALLYAGPRSRGRMGRGYSLAGKVRSQGGTPGPAGSGVPPLGRVRKGSSNGFRGSHRPEERRAATDLGSGCSIAGRANRARFARARCALGPRLRQALGHHSFLFVRCFFGSL